MEQKASLLVTSSRVVSRFRPDGRVICGESERASVERQSELSQEDRREGSWPAGVLMADRREGVSCFATGGDKTGVDVDCASPCSTIKKKNLGKSKAKKGQEIDPQDRDQRKKGGGRTDNPKNEIGKHNRQDGSDKEGRGEREREGSK